MGLRARVLGVVVLAGALGAAAIVWRSEPEPHRPGLLSLPRTAVGELAEEPWVVEASPAAAEHGAELAVDGRRAGSLPFAYRSARAGRATWTLRPARPSALAGVVVSWEGAAPSNVVVRAGGTVQTLPPADGDGESVLWWASDLRAVTQVTLEWSGGAEVGLAEVALLPAGAETWLVSARARAGWDHELLATFGIPWVARIPPGGALARMLHRGRSVVVSNAELTATDVQTLRGFVRGGGHVVELGPTPSVCGPPATGEEVASRGFRLAGDVGEDVRWFEPIARAPACDPADCASERTRVVAHARGGVDTLPVVIAAVRGEGSCVRWLGDVAHAIRTLRQGDPALAGRVAPGETYAKAADLFLGHVSGADYDVPSADRLGFALAGQVAEATGPDLVLGPLPNAAPGLVLLTADQDFVPAAGALAYGADSAGIGVTLTLTMANVGGSPDVVYPQSDEGLMDVEDAQAWVARSHGLGVHPNLVGIEATRFGEIERAHADAFARRFGVRPRVVRNHHVIWSGYVEMAALQAQAGLRMNLDYVALDRGSGFRPGFMTGSGLPMRFVEPAGTTLPIMQQATQIDDLTLAYAGDLGRAEALQALLKRTGELLGISAREHVPITVLHHPQWWFETEGAWQVEIRRVAKELSIPVWGATDWLAFTTARGATSLVRDGTGWTGNAPVSGLTFWVEGAAAVRVNGSAVQRVGAIELGGRRYGVLPPLPAGPFTIEPVAEPPPAP